MDSGKLVLANYLLVGVTAGLLLATVVYAIATWRMNKTTKRQAALLNIDMYFRMRRKKPPMGLGEDTKKFWWFSVSRLDKLLKEASGVKDPWLYSHDVVMGCADEFDKFTISADAKNGFDLAKLSLSDKASVTPQLKGVRWLIEDSNCKYLAVRQEAAADENLNIYRKWSDLKDDLVEMDIS